MKNVVSPNLPTSQPEGQLTLGIEDYPNEHLSPKDAKKVRQLRKWANQAHEWIAEHASEWQYICHQVREQGDSGQLVRVPSILVHVRDTGVSIDNSLTAATIRILMSMFPNYKFDARRSGYETFGIDATRYYPTI